MSVPLARDCIDELLVVQPLNHGPIGLRECAWSLELLGLDHRSSRFEQLKAGGVLMDDCDLKVLGHLPGLADHVEEDPIPLGLDLADRVDELHHIVPLPATEELDVVHVRPLGPDLAHAAVEVESVYLGIRVEDHEHFG